MNFFKSLKSDKVGFLYEKYETEIDEESIKRIAILEEENRRLKEFISNMIGRRPELNIKEQELLQKAKLQYLLE